MQPKVYVNIETEEIKTQIPIHEIAKRREATKLETQIYNTACKFILLTEDGRWLYDIAEYLLEEEWIANWEKYEPETYTINHLDSVDIIVVKDIWWKRYPVIAYTIESLDGKSYDLPELIRTIKKEVEEARSDIKYLFNS